MNAIYQGKVYRIGDDLNECELLDEASGTLVQRVSFGADTLIVDPTDDQVEAARNGDFIPPETCAICHENPHFEDEWCYWTEYGYGVCESCGQKREVTRG